MEQFTLFKNGYGSLMVFALFKLAFWSTIINNFEFFFSRLEKHQWLKCIPSKKEAYLLVLQKCCVKSISRVFNFLSRESQEGKSTNFQTIWRKGYFTTTMGCYYHKTFYHRVCEISIENYLLDVISQWFTYVAIVCFRLIFNPTPKYIDVVLFLSLCPGPWALIAEK